MLIKKSWKMKVKSVFIFSFYKNLNFLCIFNKYKL